jgi:hypothetical protein
MGFKGYEMKNKRRREMKNLIAIAAVFILGVLGVPKSADARVLVRITPMCNVFGWCPPYIRGWWTRNPWKPFNPTRYAACTNQVLPKRFSSPAFIFLVDACYLGDPW